VQKLLQDSDGRVSGVIAKSFGGTIYKAKANKAVILATGDYSANLDMLYYYSPWVRSKNPMGIGLDKGGKFSNTGDGHRMALWLGAKMEDGPHASISHSKGGSIGMAQFLQLNTKGLRFMNEDTGGQQFDNQLEMQPDRYSWMIFDSKWPEELWYMVPTHGYAYLGDNNKLRKQVDDSIVSSMKRGDTVTADSIEELINQMTLPAEAAKASIERYNSLAANGEDTDFGKCAKRLFPIVKPPFYATKIKACPIMNCLAGLESDENCRCYTSEGKAIEGLFVAGNTHGNRFAIEYPTTVPGLSHSMALTFGRQAGINASRALK
jgi:succinate dehydrogenase/fumarate reductase flavoprotein subunit